MLFGTQKSDLSTRLERKQAKKTIILQFLTIQAKNSQHFAHQEYFDKILGLQFFQTLAGGDNPIGTVGQRYPGFASHRWRQIGLLSGSCIGKRGNLPGHFATHCLDEGSGARIAKERHPGRGSIFRDEFLRDRTDARKRGTRVHEISLRVARTPENQNADKQAFSHESKPHRGG